MVAPTVPRTVPTVPAPPANRNVAMPTNPFGGAPVVANKRQTLKPNFELVRATPAVAMVVERGRMKHAAFDERPLIPVITGRAAIAPTALPQTLGSAGPGLKAGAKVVVDIDGRKVAAGEYQQDNGVMEDYLNSRGITERTREPARSLRDFKRQISRGQLPAATPTLLRASPNGMKALVEPKTKQLPTARARTLAEARAGLWESGDSVTLDRYTSSHELRKPPPMRPTGPKVDKEEITRELTSVPWFYKSGGEVGLDMDANSTFRAGKTRRQAGAAMEIKGHAAGIDFSIFNVQAAIESTVDHTYDKASKQFGVAGDANALHTKSGSLAIFGMAVSPNLSGFNEPAAWKKNDAYGVSAAVPVGPFLAEFKLTVGYEVGGKATLKLEDGGLGVAAEVGPQFGAWAELTAGIGLIGFSVGVGGHVALLGNQDGSGNASFTRNAFSRYTESGWKQSMGASIDSNVWALSGNLFAFVDTWWDRYDTEIFRWGGIKLGGSETDSGKTSIVWGTQQEPDYGPLKELRAFACRQKTSPNVANFPHDWTITTRTKAEVVASGCELIAGNNEVLFGKLASKWNPDTIPVAECRMETAWFGNAGVGASLPNNPIGKGPYVVNEYPMGIFNDWTDAPSEAEVMRVASAVCASNKVGSGQRATAVRIAGYAWRGSGDVLLNWKTKEKGTSIPTYRCSAGSDWFMQTKPGAPNCPADAGNQYIYRKEDSSGKLVNVSTDFSILKP